jgi:hypothetical protein
VHPLVCSLGSLERLIKVDLAHEYGEDGLVIPIW